MNASSPHGDLHGIAIRLQTSQQEIERVFSGIADRLMRVVGLLGGLTDTFDRLTGTLEREEIRNAVADLAAIARTLGHLSTVLGADKDDLVRVGAHCTDVMRMVERMRSTIGAIATLAVNARIEATYIRDEGTDFTVFTSEIGRLARASKGTIERFATGLGELAGLVGEAVTRREAFESSQRDKLGQIAQRLDASVTTIAGYRDKSLEQSRAIGDRSRAVSGAVAEVVNALQIGDITRQRMEHVEAALRLIADDAESFGPDIAAADREALAAAMCRLQSEQLVQTRAHFEDELARIAEGMRSLGAAAGAVRASGRTLRSERSGRQGSFLDDLGTDLEQAAALLGESRQARADVDRLASEVSASLADLVGQLSGVNALEVEMRLVSLNTALKCGRIGSQGRALDVIAQELRTCANQTVQHADQVKGGIRAIDALAQAMNRRETGGTGVGGGMGGTLDDLDRMMSRSLTGLRAARAAFDEALDSLDHDGESIERVLGEASQLIVGSGVGRVLRDSVEHVQRIGASAPDEATILALRDQILARTRHTYTMESERMLHDLFDGHGGGEARPVTAASDRDALDDILF